MAAIKTIKEETIEIPALNLKTFNLKIVGDSPLIVHAWSIKTKRQMLEKQMKKASKGKEARDPFEEFLDSLYWLTERPEDINPENEEDYLKEAKFGFPTVAFKAAAVDAGYQSGATKNKTVSRGTFHILGEMTQIISEPPIMREDMVRIGMGTADLRYRAEFPQWEVILPIRYNANVMSMEQIVNLFNIGGFASGIGEWRPSKDGNYGMFHVE